MLNNNQVEVLADLWVKLSEIDEKFIIIDYDSHLRQIFDGAARGTLPHEVMMRILEMNRVDYIKKYFVESYLSDPYILMFFRRFFAPTIRLSVFNSDDISFVFPDWEGVYAAYTRSYDCPGNIMQIVRDCKTTSFQADYLNISFASTMAITLAKIIRYSQRRIFRATEIYYDDWGVFIPTIAEMQENCQSTDILPKDYMELMRSCLTIQPEFIYAIPKEYVTKQDLTLSIRSAIQQNERGFNLVFFQDLLPYINSTEVSSFNNLYAFDRSNEIDIEV